MKTSNGRFHHFKNALRLSCQSDVLFDSYGLEARIRGGCGLQPITTNLLENRNLVLKKTLGDKKLSIQKAITLIIENDKSLFES